MPIFQTFPSYCSPEATKYFSVHFFVYSMLFLNKFVVDETLSNTLLQSPIARIVIFTHRAKRVPPINLLVAALTVYASASICNVPEGDLCGKIQYLMFAHCSVIDVFKCN
jgi:hypothetical protein